MDERRNERAPNGLGIQRLRRLRQVQLGVRLLMLPTPSATADLATSKLAQRDERRRDSADPAAASNTSTQKQMTGQLPTCA